MGLTDYFLTSRSAIELFQSCPRSRYYQYIYDGSGVVPASANIFLSTGSAVHKGCEILATLCRNNNSTIPIDRKVYTKWVNGAIEQALDYYKSLVENGISGKGTGENEEQKEYIYNEQISLVEGLIRAWALKELPKLAKYYIIKDIELEEVSKLPGPQNILLQGKADLVLATRDNGDIYIYSLKTIKGFDWRAEKSYRSDLQGLTEVWLAENRFKEHNQIVDSICELASKVNVSLELPKLPNRVSGVKFCFLIKGERREDKDDKGEGTGFYRTYSPLISGYRKFEAGEIQYAHSWYYPKPENKSGKSILGKGWEKFYVWENKEVGGVKGWINKLAKGDIQPSCGDILKESVVTPTEYMRSQVEMEEGIREIANQEGMVWDFIKALAIGEMDISETFPKFRKSCFYPQDCQFVRVCHKGEMVEQLMESGEMVRRVPHHEMELRQVEERLKNGPNNNS